MWLQVTGGDVVVRWEVFAAGTNQTVVAVGSPDFRISDIDGNPGATLAFPNVEIEAVAPSLNGLTSYTVEAITNLDAGINAGSLLVRGTESQSSESTSLVAFSWTNVSTWDVTYTATPGTGTRNIETSGSFIDPEGDLIVFTVTGLPEGLSIDPVTGVITGTPSGTASVDAPYTVTVTVTDGQGGSVSDTFILTATNPAPIMTDVLPVSVDAGAPFTLDIGGQTTDPDGDTMTFTATGLPEGLVIDPATGVISGVPTVPSKEPYIVEITVSDGQGGVAVQTFDLTVTENPHTPKIVRTVVLPLGVDAIGSGETVADMADDRLDVLYGESASYGSPLDLKRVFEDREREQSFRDALDAYGYHLRGGMAVAAEIPGLGNSATISVEGVAHDNSIFIGLSESISTIDGVNVTRWHVDVRGRALPDWVDYQAGSDFIVLNRPLSEETITLRIQAVLDNGKRVGGNFEIDLRTGEVELVGQMQAQSLTLSEQFAQLADAERSKDKALLDALSA